MLMKIASPGLLLIRWALAHHMHAWHQLQSDQAEALPVITIAMLCSIVAKKPALEFDLFNSMEWFAELLQNTHLNISPASEVAVYIVHS